MDSRVNARPNSIVRSADGVPKFYKCRRHYSDSLIIDRIASITTSFFSFKTSSSKKDFLTSLLPLKKGFNLDFTVQEEPSSDTETCFFHFQTLEEDSATYYFFVLLESFVASSLGSTTPNFYMFLRSYVRDVGGVYPLTFSYFCPAISPNCRTTTPKSW